MPVTTIQLVSTGMWAPSKVLSNADLEQLVETSDSWITERTGIKERRIADEKMLVSEMGYLATLMALDEAGLEPGDVDALIVSTATPDRLLPATACDIQAQLGAHNAVAFDVWGACSGWLYALAIARGLIVSGEVKNAVCIAAEKMSAIVDWTDRSTCVLFGDAAGAAVVQAARENGRGILANYMRSDGTLAELLHRPPAGGAGGAAGAAGAGGGGFPLEVAEISGNGYVQMAGREIFKAAVRSMCEAAEVVLQEAGYAIDDVDLLVPHQANIRIIEAMAKYAGIPMDRVWVNIDRYGNTSSASIPVSLHEAREQGRIKDGSLVLMVTFGAGLTWAATLLRW